MECREAGGTLLVDYVYQLLSPEAAEEMQSHLASCASCREEAEAIRKVATSLDDFEQENKSLVFYDLDANGLSANYGYMLGEHRDRRVIVHRPDPSDPTSNARLMSPRQHGAWVFRPGLVIKDSAEADVRIEAVRLPPGAKLLSCSPQFDEIHTNDRTTLVWRRVLAEWEIFGLVVVYQLQPE